jgi:hypothetical protein
MFPVKFVGQIVNARVEREAIFVRPPRKTTLDGVFRKIR